MAASCDPVGPTRTFAAIDVGTNAVRLQIGRVRADGSLEILHEERDPVQPGEHLFRKGVMRKPALDRLVTTLRRYAVLCRRHHAEVRAVATSALREARNRGAILKRIQGATGLDLEVISGTEEARLICLGVLQGAKAEVPALVIDIGGGSTEVATAVGERPRRLWSLQLGGLRLTEVFGGPRSASKRVALMRRYAAQTAEKVLPRRLDPPPKMVLGSSGTIRAVTSFAAAPGSGRATRKEIRAAIDELAEMDGAELRRRFDARRADIVLAGAIVLEAVMARLGLRTITPTGRGLRDGLLAELARRHRPAGDRAQSEAAVEVGRRFQFDEPHARQVSRIAQALLAGVGGRVAASPRAHTYLELAALLHDIGHAVSYHRHHRHTEYLLQHVELAGLSERERLLVGRIARFHRRSAPDLDHEALEDLPAGEARLVRRLATILRVADSLDRSHRQPITRIRALARPGVLTLHIGVRGPLDLELWDVKREVALFRRVFGRRLVVKARAH